MNQLMNRREFLTMGAAGALGLTALGQAARAQNAPAPRKPMNVLFIAADDLRPALGCYGDPWAITPNIDRLAATGTVFERNYCQQAVCAPSRNSLMTGLRPDSIGIYNLQTFFRTTVPDVVTLPQQFKAHGYTTARLGKIFHPSHGNHDDPLSWSTQDDRPNGQKLGEGEREALSPLGAARYDALAQVSPPTDETPAADGAKPKGGKKNGPPYESPDVPDNALRDGQIADGAIEWLQHFHDNGEPFFLGVGFQKPHLAFIAPKKYWDLHDPKKFHPSEDRTPPLGAPPYAYHGIGELATYAGTPRGKNPVSDEEAVKLIHGYYAATSYVDAQVGRVMAELDRLGLHENTIIVLWGDHGFQLGENGEWAKQNNYEMATRAPLIVSAPGFKGGQKTRALTEFVDIYPSLCEIAKVPKPSHLEGTSFVPLMQQPNRAWKSAAFSHWPLGVTGGTRVVPVTGMGRAMRTDRYRFVEWTHVDGAPTEYELYDYQTDPHEDVNLAVKPESAALVEQMKKKLHAGWKAALPPR